MLKSIVFERKKMEPKKKKKKMLRQAFRISPANRLWVFKRLSSISQQHHQGISQLQSETLNTQTQTQIQTPNENQITSNFDTESNKQSQSLTNQNSEPEMTSSQSPSNAESSHSMIEAGLELHDQSNSEIQIPKKKRRRGRLSTKDEAKMRQMASLNEKRQKVKAERIESLAGYIQNQFDINTMDSLKVAYKLQSQSAEVLQKKIQYLEGVGLDLDDIKKMLFSSPLFFSFDIAWKIPLVIECFSEYELPIETAYYVLHKYFFFFYFFSLLLYFFLKKHQNII